MPVSVCRYEYCTVVEYLEFFSERVVRSDLSPGLTAGAILDV